MVYDAIVVGGGPTGLTAALNLLRDEHKVLVLEKEGFGGQIAISPRVENIPGTNAISGMEFIEHLMEQITSMGCDFDIGNVVKIEKNDKGNFVLTTEFGTKEARGVVLAVGVKHKSMGLENEDRLVGKGISYCAVCDGAFYKDKDVVLIGDANTACQYALALSTYCNKVYLNTLFDKFFCDKLFIKKIEQRENIIVEHNLNLVKINGEEKLQSLEFENTKTHEHKVFNVDGCFIAIGQKPENDNFKNLVDLTKEGFIIVDENMQTKTPGLYAAGDCRNKKIRQLTTSFGDASIAAFYLSQYLQ